LFSTISSIAAFLIFLLVGLSPIESHPEAPMLRTKIPATVPEVIPADLTQIQKADREMWEEVVDYKWRAEKLRGK